MEVDGGRCRHAATYVTAAATSPTYDFRQPGLASHRDEDIVALTYGMIVLQ